MPHPVDDARKHALHWVTEPKLEVRHNRSVLSQLASPDPSNPRVARRGPPESTPAPGASWSWCGNPSVSREPDAARWTETDAFQDAQVRGR
jgi:hypothetical protein